MLVYNVNNKLEIHEFFTEHIYINLLFKANLERYRSLLVCYRYKIATE